MTPAGCLGLDPESDYLLQTMDQTFDYIQIDLHMYNGQTQDIDPTTNALAEMMFNMKSNKNYVMTE